MDATELQASGDAGGAVVLLDLGDPGIARPGERPAGGELGRRRRAVERVRADLAELAGDPQASVELMPCIQQVTEEYVPAFAQTGVVLRLRSTL